MSSVSFVFRNRAEPWRLDGKGAGLEAKGFPTWPILGMENHGGTNAKNREASDIYKYCTIYV